MNDFTRPSKASLGGTVGLRQRNAMTMPDRKLARLVDRAVRGGSVAGGIVPVARG